MSAGTVSLCMIVRDEEDCLPRCLEAAAPHVDEIVVVDTGSCDRTVEIAEGFGARVLHHPWQEDFSAPRNTAIEAATSDWILSLDADEVISSQAAEELRSIARMQRFVAAAFTLRSEEARGERNATMVRAFRRRPDIRYRYRIHEQVLPDVMRAVRSEGLRIARVEGEILHTGYRPEVMEARGKDSRNLGLFHKQLQETPDDLYMLFKYADFLRRMPERAPEMRAVLERAYTRLRSLPAAEVADLSFGGELCALHAMQLLEQGQPEAAAEACAFGRRYGQVTADLLFIQGNAALACGEAREAEEAFESCHEMAGRPSPIPALPHVTGPGSLTGMARARLMTGDAAGAAQHASRALELDPDSTEALTTWSDALLVDRRWGELMERLMQRVTEQPSCGATWFTGGRALFHMKLPQKALPWLMRAAELQEDPSQALALQGQAFLFLGFGEQALDAFRRGLPAAPCRAGIQALTLVYDAELEEPLDPEDKDLLAAFRQLVANIKHLGASTLADKLHRAALELETVDPRAHAFIEAALAPA